MGKHSGFKLSEPHPCPKCSIMHDAPTSSWCVRCRTDRFTRVKKRIIQKVAELEGCARCGCTEKEVLVWHHVDPKEKKFKISTTGKPWKDLLAEMQKCIVLCANCHAREHAVPTKPIRELLGIT